MDSSNANISVSYIQPNELASILKSGLQESKYSIIDVRDDDFLGGHIAGAVNVPVDKFENVANIDKIIEESQASSSVNIVFHCFKSQQRGPYCAKKFADRLNELNKNSSNPSELQIKVLQGGFEQWEKLNKTDKDYLIEKN